MGDDDGMGSGGKVASWMSAEAASSPEASRGAQTSCGAAWLGESGQLEGCSSSVVSSGPQ